MKAKLIKPLSAAETQNCPFIKVKVAARETGLGLTVTRRLGTRRIGNSDYVEVAKVNAFIAGDSRPNETGT